eukprot:COSAG02_NODE_1855_length_10650_cov_4.154677_6_plen_546_part_00
MAGEEEELMEHDKYGFSIEDREEHQKQEEYYNGRYQSALEDQRRRWSTWLEDNVVGVEESDSETRPFRALEAKSNPDILEMARKGIPPEQRGRIWLGVSGGRDRLEKSLEGRGERRYEDYKDDATLLPGEDRAKLDKAKHEIEKDLKRTFPKHETLSTEEAQQKLRSVLTAYARRNPRVGYVQSMNYIGALLLLFMEEDEAFWTLTAMVEDLLPESFYADNMSALLTELDLFDELVQAKLPRLFSHFERLSVDLKATCSQWFLLVYVNVLPLESVLRVWDSFLVEGSSVLFRVAIAVLKYHERALLAVDETGPAIMALSEIPAKTLRCNHLLRLSYDLVSAKFHSEVADLRNAKRMYESPRAAEARAMGIGASTAEMAPTIGLDVPGGDSDPHAVGVGTSVGGGSDSELQGSRANSAEPEPEPEPEPQPEPEPALIPSPRVGSPSEEALGNSMPFGTSEAPESRGSTVAAKSSSDDSSREGAHRPPLVLEVEPKSRPDGTGQGTGQGGPWTDDSGAATQMDRLIIEEYFSPEGRTPTVVEADGRA